MSKVLQNISELSLIVIGDISKIKRQNKIEFMCPEGYRYMLDSSQIIKKVIKPFNKFNPFCLDNLNLYLENNNFDFKGIEVIIDGDGFKFKCNNCNHTWVAKSSTIIRLSTGCAKCANKLTLTLDEVRIKLKDMYDNIEILDSVYENCDSKLSCRCLIHNYEFFKSWDKLKQSKKPCKICEIESKSGRNSYMWKGGLTDLNDYLRDSIRGWWIDSCRPYDFKCSISNKKSDLEVHHLNYGFSEIISESLETLSLEVKNVGEYSEQELLDIKSLVLDLHLKYGLGVPLNKYIHKSFHAMYGYGYNNKEQFLKFISYVEEIGIDNIISMYKNKQLPIIEESKMIKDSKKIVKCNETGEIFNSISELVRKYGKEYEISSPTIVNHLKHNGNFKYCPYTFSYV